MNVRVLILVTMFSLMLIVSTLQYSVLAEPISSTSSVKNETGANTDLDATRKNIPMTAAKKSLIGSPTLPSSQVLFPTEKALGDYFSNKNTTHPTFISNSSMGNTTNIQAAQFNGITNVVFQTELNGTDHVWFTAIKEANIGRGFSFSKPVELTPIHHGIISDLQIAADRNKVFVVWQNYNSTTGLNSIFVSSSMESGKVFRTYQASEINTDAIDPVVTPHGVILWKQEVPSSEGAIGSSASSITTSTSPNTNATGSDPKKYVTVAYSGW